jgi:hypothetical protein
LQNLPAGTATASATTPAAAASTTSAATTAPTTTSAASARSTSAAGRLGTSFIDVHGAAIQFRSIQLRNGGFGLTFVRHFHEREATRLARIAVSYDIYTFHGAVLRKRRVQFFLRSPEIEISDEYIGHQMCSLTLATSSSNSSAGTQSADQHAPSTSRTGST